MTARRARGAQRARRVAAALAGVAAPSLMAATTAGAALQPRVVPQRGLGVHVATLTGVAGAVVVGLVAGKPAATTGLRPGDRIVALDGRPVASSASLAAAVAHLPHAETVSLTWVDRHGTAHCAQVSLTPGLTHGGTESAARRR